MNTLAILSLSIQALQLLSSLAQTSVDVSSEMQTVGNVLQKGDPTPEDFSALDSLILSLQSKLGV